MTLAFAALAGSVSLFAQAFSGTWTCTGGYRWHITPAPGAGWTIVQWGPNSADGGTAYVGLVPKRGDWIYEDFHGDGTYAINTSPGPRGGAWTWTGTYYAHDGTSHDSVIWRRSTANRIDRTFRFRLKAGSPMQTAHDSCTKQDHG